MAPPSQEHRSPEGDPRGFDPAPTVPAVPADPAAPELPAAHRDARRTSDQAGPARGSGSGDEGPTGDVGESLDDDDGAGSPADYPCIDLVERITDYLEGALGAAEAAAIEAHLDVCDGCSHYVAQVRQVIAASAAVVERERSAELDDAVCAMFRDWHARGRSR